jgi:hypothetical protein
LPAPPEKEETPLFNLKSFVKKYFQLFMPLLFLSLPLLFAPAKLFTPLPSPIIFFKTFVQLLIPLPAPPFFLTSPFLAGNPKASAPDYKPLIFLRTRAHLSLIKFFFVSSGLSMKVAIPNFSNKIFLTTLPHLKALTSLSSFNGASAPKKAE